MKARLFRSPVLHALLLLGLAVLAGICTLREPSLGDDIDYWRLAKFFHTGEGDPWGPGFHALRWPVWGMIWLMQFVLGPGLASYYAVPLLYLGLGSLAVFAVAYLLFRSLPVAWMAGILMLFHPLLDPSVHRPMPDLPEGVWMSAAFLCWLKTMLADGAGRRTLWSALTGLAIATAYANRITGSFIAPALVVATLVCYPRRFGWLVLAGGFTLLFLGIEGLVYYRLTGDFLHSLHANLGARGRKGTESVPLWQLPFRFVDSLWTGSRLKPSYAILAVLGAVKLWRHSPAGRAVVVWFAMVFAEYSMGVQSLSEPRPLVRDGDRFISCLAAPMTIMASAGILFLGELLFRLPFSKLGPVRNGVDRLRKHGAIACALLFALLFFSHERPGFDLGWVRSVRSFLKGVPSGHRVVSDADFRDICLLADQTAGSRIDWMLFGDMLHQQAKLEAALEKADGVWFRRKSLWLTARKQLEREEIAVQEPTASFLEPVSQTWRAAKVALKDETPDLIFLERREPQDPPPSPIEYSEIANRSGLPSLDLPERFEFANRRKLDFDDIAIDSGWRGRTMRLFTRASGYSVEAYTAKFRFRFPGGKIETELNPYLYPNPGIDLFFVPIPENAESVSFHLTCYGKDGWIKLDELRISVE